MSSLTTHPECVRLRDLGYSEPRALAEAARAEELDRAVRAQGMRVHRDPKMRPAPRVKPRVKLRRVVMNASILFCA